MSDKNLSDLCGKIFAAPKVLGLMHIFWILKF